MLTDAVSLSSLTPGATYPVWVRAKGASGLYSSPALVASPALTMLAAGATFTSEVLKDWTDGRVLASAALDYFRLYNPTTGALVVSKTGLSTNASGIVSFSDAGLLAGTQYKADWKITTTGETRMPTKAAV